MEPFHQLMECFAVLSAPVLGFLKLVFSLLFVIVVFRLVRRMIKSVPNG